MTNREAYINEHLAQLSDRITKTGVKSNILYVVSDEREIPSVICGCSNFKKLLKNIVGTKKYTDYHMVFPQNMYRKLRNSGEMIDVAQFFSNKKSEQVQINFPQMFMIRDFHTIHSQTCREGVELLKKYLSWVEENTKGDRKMLLIIISPIMDIPIGFEHEMSVIDVPEIGETEISDYITKKYSFAPGEEKTTKLVSEFKGLSFSEIDSIMERVYSTFNSYIGTQEVIDYRRERINAVKEQQAKQDSTISVIRPKNSVAGMAVMQEWAKSNIKNYVNPVLAKEHGIPRPKGVLFCGLPGTGKTQMAKKIAYDMTETNGGITIPLIQFKMENILGGLVGDSEKNFKRCRKKIEALAPCIVLFDEIEKTFNSEKGSGKNDYKMNILTALLDWLQENDKVFFFATCNGTTIPPELLREGRFDMKFSVFLPPQEELSDIMKIHMERFNGFDFAKGKLYSEDFDIAELINDFFDEIAKIIEKTGDYLFYTGSNIESLLIKTNTMLASESDKMKYNNRTYLSALIKVATNGESQPYGKTNMKDIVEYWQLAKKNNYCEVSRPNLFDFKEFDGSCPVCAEALTNYNRVMRETIFMELKKELERTTKSR